MSLKFNKNRRPKGKPTRKQLRKEKRKEKKAKRNEYYTKKGRNNELSTHPNSESQNNKALPIMKKIKKNKSVGKEILQQEAEGSTILSSVLSTEDQHKKEKREQKRLQKDMSKQRKEQLLKANIKEDQNIRKLEKQLNLHKRKSKTIPKSFAGLDYLLEITDPEIRKNIALAEQDLNETGNEFEEDFALMTGKGTKKEMKALKKKIEEKPDKSDSEDNFEDLLNEDDFSDDDLYSEEQIIDDHSSEETSENFELSDDESIRKNKKVERKDTRTESKKEKKQKTKGKSKCTDEDNSSNSEEEMEDQQEKKGKKRKKKGNEKKNKKVKNAEKNHYEDVDILEDSGKDVSNSELEDNDTVTRNDTVISNSDKDDSDKEEKEKYDVWEDIYGRLRAKDGSVINKTEGKYIPPALRAKMEGSGSEDKKRKEKLDRLRKQLKGLLNRLAESNMHSIASQIENLYMNNSRNDMNETVTTLVTDSLITNVLTPERLLMEHVLLIAILHANVGTEVGAHFLQTIIKKFAYLTEAPQKVEDKSLDNVVNILAQLYNFKLFDAKLVYEILQKLTETFNEKNVECILHILRSVGFGLRKDDPIALKNLILELQKQAATSSEGQISSSRVKFLLDIVLAIKNNNVTKIPNYDTSYSEHLKKIMKGFIRKGNYVTQLNITLDDLLKAEERGRWWVVGSAWSGKSETVDKKEEAVKSEVFSQKLLELARKQRMNTDSRRNIFCIIISAEDYLDAFEKLLKLGLKNQQEREIIHVILHCCLKEKNYNPYYAVLAQKFCEYDRKFQMTIKYSVWDKLKALNNHSGEQISNLAKLLIHLFIEKGLSISTLKVVEFSELDKVTLRFVRQVLLGIILHKDIEALQGVFEKVAQSDKLKMFRESLRLFIHHFLLKNLKSGVVPEDQKQHLEERAKMVEKMLTAKDGRMRL